MLNKLLQTALILPFTVAAFVPPTYAQYTGGNTTLIKPTRIRAPKFATQPSTKQNPNCECPYDRAYKGSICGKRSAYVRPGENEPACYVGEKTARELWWNNPNNQFVDKNRLGR
ncbi:hypothetical protein DSM106972_089640 [Dulcicalothrix desertica PCC 7102]|uniref:Uncharacterized protein n=1 Tax=Dulcicalothrix desertica PCC 7102 TaxID=232991 RepID=A0A433UP41_9CYAN|nr:hypothetical protein [Dulcicalothrix desertica]RUS95608.1 hypothetical protein DSM106972_089640 [Dulcicalothrix desertica PCC 7102]TWH39943.1 hypothetical protein CAL7102_09223 [Dulcicalothrix desertica PCC 7102]